MSLDLNFSAHEYQLACVEYFRNTHEGHSGDGVGNNPIAYFAESIGYYSAADTKTKESTKADAAPRNA